jgi:hypothetical protein
MNVDLETTYKKELIRSEKWNRISNFIQSIGSLGSVAIAIAIFLAISLPQSSLNKEMSDKERATLLIDVLKEKDTETRNMLILALRDFYPEIDKRFLEIKKEVYNQALNELKEKLNTEKTKLKNCTNELEKKDIELNIQFYECRIKEIMP